MSEEPDLPLVDEHAVDVEAPPSAVWPALLATVDEAFSGRVASVYALVVRCSDPRSGGPRPLAEGSTLVGFRVAVADPPHELVLAGHHGFSTYTLTFRLAPAAAGTHLTATTHARFPGLHGRLYRQAILRTGAHVRGVRGLLDATRRRAEG
jgi:hypothetical protein